MEYKTKGGQILTDEKIEEMGDACDQGEIPGTHGEWVIAPPGRPQLYPNENLVTIAFKVPETYRDLLDARAKASKSTRSQYLRELLNNTLIT
ncbi:MAG: hypothetical protein FWD41_04925 [Actinomycetia bacterium]|nr:hypothetical protein [Actinomycetes bacterium]